MSDYKTCPLMRGTYDDVLVFRNIEVDDETIKVLKDDKSLGLKIADDGPSTIEPLTGTCKEGACAWWDELKQCCAVLTIAKSSRQK